MTNESCIVEVSCKIRKSIKLHRPERVPHSDAQPMYFMYTPRLLYSRILSSRFSDSNFGPPLDIHPSTFRREQYKSTSVAENAAEDRYAPGRLFPPKAVVAP